MDKNLLKFYISLFIGLIVFILAFSSISNNINNGISYIKHKLIINFKNINKDNNFTSNIYNDKGNIIIMFDDGWYTQYSIGYKYLNKLNMRGSIGIISSSVGTSRYMNLAEIQEVYNSNWDILNHTYSHIDLSDNSIEEQEEDISKGKEWLEKNGFTNNSNILIFPYGNYEKNTKQIVKDMGIISGRGTKEGFNSIDNINLFDVKIKQVLSETKPETVYEWIDSTIANKYTLILLFHRFEHVTEDLHMQYEPNDFYKIVDYINSHKENLNVITYSDLVRYITLENEK